MESGMLQQMDHVFKCTIFKYFLYSKQKTPVFGDYEANLKACARKFLSDSIF